MSVTPLPAALAALFVGKATISIVELAEKLPMDQKTLRRHIQAGRLTGLTVGIGRTRVRRAFRESDVTRFLNALSEPTPETSRALGQQPPPSNDFLSWRGTMNVARRKPRKRVASKSEER